MDSQLKHLNLRVIKLDEERRLVYGVAADETPDSAGEIFDYSASKPLFQEWSQQIADATDGKSVGNVREQHDAKRAVGKLTSINFDDAAKAIEVCAKIVDDQAWQKAREGVYTGFSIGGKYTARWTDADNPKLKRYAAQPYEVSIVDYPANPNATFEMLKSDGTTEEKRFAEKAEARTKRVDGVDLPASSFLYVGDPQKTDTWHLPVEFPGDEAKTKSHIRNALARFDQTELPADKKSELKAKLLRLAHEHDIDTSESEKSEKAANSLDEMFALVKSIEAQVAALGIPVPITGDHTVTLEKAKSVHARLKAVHKAIGDHAERHAAHAKAVQEDLERAMKAVGASEEVELDPEKAEGSEGQEVEGDERSGAEALDPEKAVTAGDLKKAMAEAYEAGVKAAVAAVRGNQGVTTGIGNRAAVVKRSAAQAAKPAIEKPSADVIKAADAGDEAAQLQVGRWLRKNQRPATFQEISIFNGARQ
ncbi:MAG: hypothetical protein ACRD2H_11480 [Terriglobales bacterium]